MEETVQATECEIATMRNILFIELNNEFEIKQKVKQSEMEDKDKMS